MKKATILIVEDENVVSTYLQNVLTNLGYEVTMATGTGEEAIEKASIQKPDLVLMDIALKGGMDGMEAAKIIKDTYDIPVIYVTGNADIDTVQRARETEPYGYVMKPINLLDLFSTIDTALHRHNLQMRLKESEEKYRSLVESTSDWVWAVDQNGRYTYTSPHVKDLLGYEPHEVIGKTLFDFMPPEEVARLTKFANDMIKSQKPFFGLENVNLRKDGSRIILETSGVPFFDTSGVIQGYRGIDRDITERKNAEQALRESEERFRALVQNLQDIIVILNSEGIVIYENPVTSSVLGYSLLGKNYAKLIHPDDLATAMRDFEEVVKKTNPHVPTLVRVLHADGSWIYLEILATNLFDNTTIQGGLFVCRNVTDRIKAQTALQESEERYRALFNQSPAGVLIFNSKLIATDCSERLAVIMHTQREMIIGQDLGLIKESALVSKLHAAIDGSISVYEGAYEADNSSLFIYVTLEASPLRDAGGNVVGGIAVIQDITEKKIAEERLKASEERMRLVVDNANQGIIIIKDGRVVFANKDIRDVGVYSFEEIISRPFLDFIHPDDRRLAEERYIRRFKGDTPQRNLELRLIDADKKMRWVEINAVRLDWEGGPALLCFLKDITGLKLAAEEHRKIEAQLQQAQKLESLGVLAGGIAHDFNNLLMAILGNVDLALLDLAPGSPSRANLLEAVKASQRAADLCRQMLAYSGRGQFVNEALNMNEIVNDMQHMLAVSISKKALLHYHLSSGLPAIKADATQIRQIVMNLVINASDAIDDKSGIITVSTGVMHCDSFYLSETWLNEQLPDGFYAYLDVADTGSGMDKDTLPKIFDPFFTTKFTGRGLGLAAVLGIVRGHKGAIKVHSEKNKGTAFKILFPVAAMPAKTTAAGDTAEEIWRGSGTILLADDEEAIRVLGEKMLKRLGFAVLLAADGRDAIELFRKHKDKIVCTILDLTMPRMDGEETFRELRKINKNVRVIMSSGYNEQEITQRYSGKKLTGFIQKPYQMAELSAKLKQILG